jgi:hypothetical protein
VLSLIVTAARASRKIAEAVVRRGAAAGMA